MPHRYVDPRFARGAHGFSGIIHRGIDIDLDIRPRFMEDNPLEDYELIDVSDETN